MASDKVDHGRDCGKPDWGVFPRHFLDGMLLPEILQWHRLSSGSEGSRLTFRDQVCSKASIPKEMKTGSLAATEAGWTVKRPAFLLALSGCEPLLPRAPKV